MTLDDLIALNDEIAALVRAGVPLERGLAELGAEMPGRMGQVAATLAEKTARGVSLETALMDQAVALPPAYRAVVQAGARAGRLPAALEAVAASARRTSETQRAAVVAVTYPLLVVSLVWIGLAFFCVWLAPSLAASLSKFNVPVYKFFAALASIGHHWAWIWGPAVPILFALLLLMWWRESKRAAVLDSRSANRLFGWIPWMGRMLQYTRSATFLDVLALLIENDTPLDEAVALAASASGDPKTIRAARRVGEMIRNGEMTSANSKTPPHCNGGALGGDSRRSTNLKTDSTFPPLVSWLVLAAGRGGVLVPALRHSAEGYHRRARVQSDMVRAVLPSVLTVAIGGSITAAYALMLFVPYISLLNHLSK